MGRLFFQYFNNSTPLNIELGTLASETKDENILEFNVLTVNKNGEISNVYRHSNQCLTEELENSISFDLVFVPPGSFQMGSPSKEVERNENENPLHTVNIQSFFIGKYQVTQAQWRAVAFLSKIDFDLEPDPASFKDANFPVENITWYEAIEFCKRLSNKTGRFYRLPSEAEWEFACRAGTVNPFHFGNTISTELANYNGKVPYDLGKRGIYRKETTEVGSFNIANVLGIYDMHGNVWEWCQDKWHNDYEGAPTNGTAWEIDGYGSQRVVRGGSWDRYPRDCRSATRNAALANYKYDTVGLRVVCSSV